MKRIIPMLLIGILIFGGFGASATYETVTISILSPILEKYDMVIIAPVKFSRSIQPLIDHKNNYGVQTFLKTVEDIYNGYEGRDEEEQIKFFIKDAIENFCVEYVLLFGSIDEIPIRKCAVSWDYFGELFVNNIISDLYYGDIYDKNGSFCSWDSNNDSIFCEYIMKTMVVNETYRHVPIFIDDVDLYPDVGIGRLPCKNVLEVRFVINKIITYESQSFGKDWFNRIILMGGDTFPNWGDTYEGEVINEYVANSMDDFKPVRLWTSKGNFRRFLINSMISLGAGFVCFSGHGFEYGFGTYPPNNENMICYYTPNILGMFNGKRFPIIFLDACSTAKLDYSIVGVKFPCFAWAIVKKPFGGAVASVGATALIYGTIDPLSEGFLRLDAEFFDSYEPGIVLSRMLMNAQKNYLDSVWKDCLTIAEAILIGDPSLKVGGYPS